MIRKEAILAGLMAVLLVLPLVFAQAGNVDDSARFKDARSFSEFIRVPIEWAERAGLRMVEELNRSIEWFARIPRNFLGLEYAPISEQLPPGEKLKLGLQEQALSGSAALVRVNVVGISSGLKGIEFLVESVGGIVHGTYRVGSIVSAEVPGSSLNALAGDLSVLSVWPEREFHASLDSSVGAMNVPALWTSGFTGNGVRVAVIDSGVDGTHSMLQGKVISAASFTGEPVGDVLGHGTHVAGIIAGKKNAPSDFNGVAPEALLLDVKVLNSQGIGLESNIVAGINYAVDPDGNPSTPDGAQVINLSLGGPYTSPNSPLVQAVEAAIAQGIVVVAAAGNCGPDCPSVSCNGFVGVEDPGTAPNAITVGTVNDFSEYACFSSGGLVNGVMKPDVVAPGVNVTSSTPLASYETKSGTSMSAPHVAGLAALVLEANPGMPPGTLKYLLEQTALDAGPLGKDAQYGSGIVDAYKLVPSGVFKLLKYTLSVSSSVAFIGDTLNVSLSTPAIGVKSVFITVKTPNGSEIALPVNGSAPSYFASFSSTLEVGNYVVEASVESLDEGITTVKETFTVVKQPTTGVVQDIQVPASVAFGVPITVPIAFQNTGAFDTEVVMELQEWKEGLFEGVRFSAPTAVSAGQTLFIPVQWTPKASLGAKTLRAVAIFDTVAVEYDENVGVVDTASPVIESIEFEGALKQFNSLYVRVHASDISSVSAALNVTTPTAIKSVPLLVLNESDSNHTLAGIFESTELGSHSFSVTLCDTVVPGNCTTSQSYAFTVSPCSLPKALVIVSEGYEGAFDVSSNEYMGFFNNYCMSVWPLPLQVPSKEYVDAFQVVHWDARDSLEDVPSSSAWGSFQDYNGLLVLEGSQVAFASTSDDAFEDLLHASWEKKLYFDTAGPAQMSVQKKHVLFSGLPSVLDFNMSAGAFSPDAVMPNMNGVQLSVWNDGSGNVLAFQEGLQKRLLVPFSSRHLKQADRQAFLSNAFAWGADLSGSDGVVEGIALSYLVQGPNRVTVFVKNQGVQALAGIPVDLYVDGVFTGTKNTSSIQPGAVQRLTFGANLASGTHSLHVELNAPALADEFNTLNNEFDMNIWVAPAQPNAVVQNIAGSYDNNVLTVFTHVANLGGQALNNLRVDVNVSGTVQQKFVTLLPGKEADLNASLAVPKGNYNVSVTVDPLNTVVEADETDNVLAQTLYFCTKESVLVVNDDNAMPFVDVNASSALFFVHALQENGYCVQAWNKSVQGAPSLQDLNPFELVVWSAGDYWNGTLDANDQALILGAGKPVLFEGNDVAFDHADGNFLQDTLGTAFVQDVTLSGFMQVAVNDSIAFPGLSTLDLNLDASGFPDALQAVGSGVPSGFWPDGNASMVRVDVLPRKMIWGFALDNVMNEAARVEWVGKAVEWLKQTPNQPPGAPNALTCNAGSCTNTFTGPVQLACSGSVDPEANPITYEMEAFLFNPSSLWWDDAFPYCINVTLDANSSLEYVNEPVDVFLDSTVWSQAPYKNSLRVVNSACGQGGLEVPSQTYESTFTGNDYNSTRLAFLANKPAGVQASYGIYYAVTDQGLPSYGSDLVQSGDCVGSDCSMENSVMKAHIDHNGGVIYELFYKPFSSSKGLIGWNYEKDPGSLGMLTNTTWNGSPSSAIFDRTVGDAVCSVSASGPVFAEVTCSKTGIPSWQAFRFYNGSAFMDIRSFFDGGTAWGDTVAFYDGASTGPSNFFNSYGSNPAVNSNPSSSPSGGYGSFDRTRMAVSKQESTLPSGEALGFTYASRLSHVLGGSDNGGQPSFGGTWYPLSNLPFSSGQTHAWRLTFTTGDLNSALGQQSITAHDRFVFPLVPAFAGESSLPPSGWWNFNWKQCRTVTLTDPLPVLIPRPSTPVFLDLNAFGNSASEVRIVNAACGLGGNEIPSHASSAQGKITFLADLNGSAGYAVYYDNPSAQPPAYAGSVIATDSNVSWAPQTSISLNCPTAGIGRVTCNHLYPSGYAFNTQYPGASGPQAALSFYADGWKAFDFNLAESSPTYARWNGIVQGDPNWTAEIHAWSNALSPLIKVTRTGPPLSVSELRFFDTRYYNPSFDSWVFTGLDGNLSVLSIQGLATLPLGSPPLSGYWSSSTGEAVLFFGGPDTVNKLSKTAKGYCEGASSSSKACNYAFTANSSTMVSTGDTFSLYFERFPAFTPSTPMPAFNRALSYAVPPSLALGAPVIQGDWQFIGAHPEGASLAWDTNFIPKPAQADLRCRAIDLNGSGQYSAYYTVDANMNLA
ncbi:MAG: S8 family serine peptidase [Candidatus Diapherotrites archaeon]|nr:S8 family serine peptidase [Candidatus Diapherotrites archaeon]